MYGRSARSWLWARGKLVIRLQFVTLKRLEATVLGWRVKVGEQSVMLAESVEFFGHHGAELNIGKKLDHFQSSISQPARRRLQARAPVGGAQGMVSARGVGYGRISLACEIGQ